MFARKKLKLDEKINIFPQRNAYSCLNVELARTLMNIIWNMYSENIIQCCYFTDTLL